MTQTTSDRVALRDLVQAYAEGCDTKNAALLRSCFTENAVLTVHWVDRDATSMVFPDGAEQIPRGLARYDLTFHFIGNHRVEIDGDDATGHTYCFAHHIRGTDDHIMAIRYDDTYRREADGWKIAERHLRHLWNEETTVGR
jgi:ketosteroid isomerase-like protein